MPTKTSTISIIDAMKDPNLFGPFFENDLTSWRRWMICLRCIFGLPIRTEWGKKLVRECTGRDADKLPKDGFQTSLLLVGRRSGKSKTAATLVTFLATLAGLESRLTPGETGLVALIAPTKLQTKIVRGYIRSLLSSPMLEQEIVKERTLDAFQLRSGIRLELLASDYRSTRGFSLVGCCIDEVCFLGTETSSKVRAASAIIQSVLPSLATTNGKLIAISSPYSKSGWAWDTFKKHHGNDSSRDVLVWNAASRVMNPTLPQSVVTRAMREDLAAAKSEYLAEFRDDVSNFVPIELIEALIVRNRFENMRMPNIHYQAFCDLSGGRNDGAALAIGHLENGKVILDSMKNFLAPHNPHQVIATMSSILREWGIHKICADAYAGEFASSAFVSHGIAYKKSPKNKSDLYGELLPVISAGKLELLDGQKLLVKQLSNLERRTRSGGRDSIDHPIRQNDDVANALAGVVYVCNQKRLIFGSGGF